MVLKKGGEGLILRRPLSLYERGRSDSLFKLKASRNDGEALIVNLEGDAITMQLPDNQLVQLTLDAQTTSLKVGNIITFTCDSYTPHGTPVNPKIMRVRKDVSWSELVAQFQSGNSANTFGKSNRIVSLPARKPHQKWRQVFLMIAKERGFDPLEASNWYQLRRRDLRSFKNYRRMFNDYAIGKALIAAFPTVEFDLSKFWSPGAKYYRSFTNQRRVFESIAKSEGFDPLVPENWYPLRSSVIYKYPGARVVSNYHKHYHRAILHMFPSIGIDLSKFIFQSNEDFKIKELRQRFMDDVCGSRQFDPLVNDNWYFVFYPDLLTWHKRMPALLKYYLENIPAAINDLYPSISFDLSSIENKKKLFNNFAATRGFDPLIPKNWYKTSKGLQKIFKHHFNTSISTMLSQVYPNIGLDPSCYHKFLK